MSELAARPLTCSNGRPVEPSLYPQQIAFQSSSRRSTPSPDNGYTREEMKMVWETQKILGMPASP